MSHARNRETGQFCTGLAGEAFGQPEVTLPGCRKWPAFRHCRIAVDRAKLRSAATYARGCGVVFLKAEPAKAVHEEAEMGASGAGHLRQGRLRELGNELLARLAKPLN